jgi:ABC-type Fe3+ transport system permease subunit
VALFDAHAGGLALSESLRRMILPLLAEAAAIGTAFMVLSKHRVAGARRSPEKERWRWLAWGHLVIAFTLVMLIPAAKALWGTVHGFGLLWENFVLSREILASLLFAAGGSVLAGLAVFGLGTVARGNRIGSTAGKVILVVAVGAGLLGPLVLALAVLAAVQRPGLIRLRDTPAPLVLTLGLVLLPTAFVLKRVLELTGPRSARHLTRLMQRSRALRELTWKLNTSGKFWALGLLFIWAYWDLTASAILAPIGMTPVTVRLYNLMHYGRIEALSAMTCAAFAAPVGILLLALGTRRWWAPS